MEVLLTAFRSLLFVPGNRQDMIDKAMHLWADVLVLDMEDSVPMQEKEAARETVASNLPDLQKIGHTVYPRPNSLDTGLLARDLASVIGPYIQGVTIGKINSAWDIDQIVSIIWRLEEKSGLPGGHIKIIPWIESAKAIVNAYEICAASPRVCAVAFGAEDFTNDMGIERTDEGVELDYPRRVISIAARAAGIIALDTPYVNFRDPEGHRLDITRAKSIGFQGKFAIHPTQVKDIDILFTPSEGEINYAKRVIAAFEEAEGKGRGATSLDGKMIDVPVVRRARALLLRAVSPE
jgi:citrate lyase subunit beta/citryl-CoA lyase